MKNRYRWLLDLHHLLGHFLNLKDSISSLIVLLTFSVGELHAQDPLNILLIIGDDIGLDVTNGYSGQMLLPSTPTLDSLRSVGITFDNVWSAPVCTPTRAAIMSGKYGIKTGVLRAPGNLDTIHTSLYRALETATGGAYSDALVGKWHISQPQDAEQPHLHGIDYYMGSLGAGVDAYDDWQRTEDGHTITDTGYVTTRFSDAAIDWIKDQTGPWLMWQAHVAPHAPNHLPPSHMYTISPTNSNFRRYLAMVESLDFEIGRLLNSMSLEDKANTLVIYLGDNGTPNNFLRDYPDGHGKSTLYQGGINVPMIISGAGVTRPGEREDALIHVTDLYATILEVAGADLPGGIYNSLSFDHLLSDEEGPGRDYNYSEINQDWTIRNRQYKLIQLDSGVEEFYNLESDPYETIDLQTSGLTNEQALIKEDLETEAAQIRSSWSCRDYIKNGDEEDIDCGGSQCEGCLTTATESSIPNKIIRLFPNPVRQTLTVAGTSDRYEVSVRDMLGRRIIDLSNQSSTASIDFGDVPSGLYLVSITTTSSDELPWTKLILKQ